MHGLLLRGALTLVLAAIVLLVILHREQINLEMLDAWLGALGPWAPIGYVMLYALGAVAFAPGVAFALAGRSNRCTRRRRVHRSARAYCGCA